MPDQLPDQAGTPEEQVYDPLASLRTPGAPELDVLIWGTVFLDIIFTGLDALPEDGQEVWADGMGSCPGGIANLAVAARRLGLRTSLAAAFGDDAYGDFCWETLADYEHVDLSRSQRFEGWHSPVTVSMAVNRDRGMVSHGHAPPLGPAELIGTPPPTRAVMVELSEQRLGGMDPVSANVGVAGGCGQRLVVQPDAVKHHRLPVEQQAWSIRVDAQPA